MSLLESMIYGELAFFHFYFLPLWCFATIPQLCLLDGIALYPKVRTSTLLVRHALRSVTSTVTNIHLLHVSQVSNPYFVIFLFIFLSALSKHLQEVLLTGGSFQSWRNEQRIWMMKSVTTYLHGSLDAIMKKMGMREASFFPTNKVVDDEQVKLYQMGKLDFQTSNMFLVPMVALIILNMASFVGGLFRVIFLGDWDKMFVQVFISFYILLTNFPIIEGMMIRKDKGRIRSSVTLLSAMFSCGILFLGFIILL